MANITMLDLAKRQNNDTVTGIIDEAVTAAPEFAVLPMKPIIGTSFKTLHRTAYPEGGFRSVNAGVTPDKSTSEQRLTECFFFDSHIEIDEAIVDADEGELGDLIVDEGAAVVSGALQSLGKQVYYGRGSDNTLSSKAKGFKGLTEVYDSSSMVVDAGSTTDSVCTSVWMLHAGRQGVELVAGKNAALTMSDVVRQRITKSSKELFAFVGNLRGWYGLKVGHAKSIGRVGSIDDSATLTEDMLFELYSKFPVNLKPTHVFMNRRAYRQYIQDRRAVASFSGTDQVTIKGEINMVDRLVGIGTTGSEPQIIVTDSILDTEDDI